MNIECEFSMLLCDVCKILTMHAHMNIMKEMKETEVFFFVMTFFALKMDYGKCIYVKEMNIAVNSSLFLFSTLTTIYTVVA
jgi:hypothetical protein